MQRKKELGIDWILRGVGVGVWVRVKRRSGDGMQCVACWCCAGGF